MSAAKTTGRAALLTLAVVTGTAPNSRAAVIPGGLIGYWAAEGNANDSSPTGNNGTFAGSYVSGPQGGAFNLSTGVVTIPDSPAYSLTADYSIGFWFNANGQGGGTFVGQDNGGGSQNKWFVDYGYTGGHFELHLNGSGGGVFLDSNAASLPAGWNQLTVVKNGTTYTFYLNGAAIGSPTSAVSFSDPTAPLEFGFAEGGVPQYHGLLDEVTIYNRALSSGEVAVLANVPEPALGTACVVAAFAARCRRSRRSRA